MRSILLATLMGIICMATATAQDFHTLFNDPTANFYDIKAAAKEYFKDKDQ